MPTRFYFSSSSSTEISPAVATTWEHTGDLVRRRCGVIKDNSASASAAFTDEGAHGLTSSDTVLLQYISDPIEAQTLDAQIVDIQFRGSETAAGNNISLTWLIKVVSNNGTSVTGTALAIRRDASEFATSLTNRSDSATTTAVTANAGDRIVFELGHGGSTALGGGHNGTISLGSDSATDLAVDDTTTTADNPWIEFANAITFAQPPGLGPSRESQIDRSQSSTMSTLLRY